MLREGNDLAIIACGVEVPEAMEAAEALANEGIQARVIDMATIKPIDRDAVLAAARDCGAILTADQLVVAVPRLMAAVVGAISRLKIPAPVLVGFAASTMR